MPPVKRLTVAQVRAIVGRLGTTASYAAIARRTGHPAAEVRKLCEAQGIFLPARSAQGGTAPGDDRAEGMGPPTLVDHVKEVIWDPLSGRLPPISRREYDALLSEWYSSNRSQGDRTPFEVLFRDHRKRPRVEAELSRTREELGQLRASGPFRRGQEEGYRKGYDEGYARARSDFLSRVQLPCALCGRPVLVDFGERGGARTPARALLEGYLVRRVPGPCSIIHVDCNDPARGEGVIEEAPRDPNRWSLVTPEGKTTPLEGPAWSQLIQKYRGSIAGRGR
jgi:hypothetical protein